MDPITEIKLKLRAMGFLCRYTEWMDGHQVGAFYRHDIREKVVTDWCKGELTAWETCLQEAEKLKAKLVEKEEARALKVEASPETALQKKMTQAHDISLQVLKEFQTVAPEARLERMAQLLRAGLQDVTATESLLAQFQLVVAEAALERAKSPEDLSKLSYDFLTGAYGLRT